MLGVRGSTPSPGADFIRYGGHTSCVALTVGTADYPSVILDAGTGLRTLTPLLQGEPFHGAILLSHLHWDHMQGLPFFSGGDKAGSDVEVYLPAQDGRSGSELIAHAMSPPAFPITPEGLLGTWTFNAIEPGSYEIGSLQVRAEEIRHKGGRTYGYRLADDDSAIAFLPDHLANGARADVMASLLQGVDLLIHDAQFLDSERPVADAYGHSTVGDAIKLADEYDVPHLMLFHHGPQRTDAQLDQLADDLEAPMRFTIAREGEEIPVRPTSDASGAPEHG
jgi:phosphoribosyl 1,2-cyclic phosphodiesterase